MVGDRLVDVEPGDTTDRLFGVSIDVGTTTVVATLMDLRAGAAAAVESTINRQAPFGADVLTRVSHTQMHGPEALEQLRERPSSRTIDGLLGSVCATAGIAREAVLEVVAAGNATMLHLLLGVDPESIGRSPFIATFLEAQDLRAADAGIDDPPGGPARAVPLDRRVRRRRHRGRHRRDRHRARGRQRGCWSTSARTARSSVGNEERVVTTAAPAGPAFEGGQILHGMRATEGAIEGVVLDVAPNAASVVDSR